MLDLKIPFAEEYLFEVDGRLSGDVFITNCINLNNGRALRFESKKISLEKKPFVLHISKEEMDEISEVLLDVELERKLKEKNIRGEEIEVEATCKLAKIPYIEDPEKREEFFDENFEADLKFCDLYEKVRFVNNLLHGGIYKEPPSYLFTSNKRKSSGRIKLVGLCLTGLLVSLGYSYYLYFYLPEQIKKPYKKAGLTDEQASKFISSYPQQNGNSTWVEFAKAWVKNKQLADKAFSVCNNLKDSIKFINFAKDNQSALSFLEKYPKLVKSLNYEYPLMLYSKNSTVFNELYRNISQDPRINVDKNNLTSLASKLFLDLGYYGKVKVLIPGSNSYREVPVIEPLVWYVGNYSDGSLEYGLPMHGRNDIFHGGNATLINPIIFDFNPIIIKDFEGNTYVIQSKNIARDYWMIVEHLKYTPYVVKHPEMYEAFNVKVKQNAWDILDNPVMHKLKEHYKPTDKVIWETVIIPQWNYYWNATPQADNVSKRITVFPWYNSTLLKQWIANDTDRKIALIYFWKIPIGDEIHGIADLDAWLRYMDVYLYGSKEELTDYLKHHKPIVYHKGLDAMQYVIKQMPRVYKDVMRKYPSWVFYNAWNEPIYPRSRYYGWLGDRQVWGLNNAIKQFAGDIRGNWTDVKKDPSIMLKYSTIDTYLTKNFAYWDLIKFIYSGLVIYGWDSMKAENLYLPIAVKAFGIPHTNRGVYYEHHINGSPPYHYAMGYEDIIFGLPDSVLQPLKQGKYHEVLIFPGNGISCIGSPLYGIKKDLEYGKQHPVEPNAKYIEMYLPIRGKRIYLFKGGKKG